MSKLTKEEIAARRKSMQEEALKSVAKTEQLNIRIDEASITRLYAHASKQGKPVGTMVREWTIERLQTEEEDANNQPSYAALAETVTNLHRSLNRWEGLVQETTNWKKLKAEQDAGVEPEIEPEFESTDEQLANASTGSEHGKQLLSIRLDSDIVRFFKAQGPGYQTRINEVLRAYVSSQQSNSPEELNLTQISRADLKTLIYGAVQEAVNTYTPNPVGSPADPQ
jgi:uncharacterized protein (DUF4415 family)